MPQVPIYQQQVAPAASPSVHFDAPNVQPVAAQEMKNLGDSMVSAGGALAQIQANEQQQANAAVLNDRKSRLIVSKVAAIYQGRKILGKDALEAMENGKGLPDAAIESFDKVVEEEGKGLNTAQQAAYQQMVAEMKGDIHADLTAHLITEGERYKDDSDESLIKSASAAMVLTHDNAELSQKSKADLDAAFNGLADRKGWDKQVRDDKYKAYMSPVHMGVVKKLIREGRAAEADLYLNGRPPGEDSGPEVKGVAGEMNAESYSQIQEVLRPAVIDQAGEAAAKEVWGSDLGPKKPNDPVRMFAMKTEIDKRVTDPAKREAALKHLAEMEHLFNNEQAEVNSGNVNAVYSKLDGGTPLSAVKKSDEWMALPATKQHEIMDEWRSSQERRQDQSDKLLFQAHAAEYMAADDPETLMKMSRGQVAAKRTLFGNAMTMRLLEKYDSLHKPGGLEAAKMDQTDFMEAAEDMGLHPYDKNNSEDHRKMLGALKYRVENMIYDKQKHDGKPMTREEKQKLMKGEVATSVTLRNKWLYDGILPTEKSAITLTKDEVKRVIVPDEERRAIISDYQNKYGSGAVPSEDLIRQAFAMKHGIE